MLNDKPRCVYAFGFCGEGRSRLLDWFGRAIALQLSLKVTMSMVFTRKAEMTAKDKIHAEIDSLNEEYLDELYLLIQDFAQSKQHLKKPSFMSKLKQIKINAPEDFASNLDSYLAGDEGEK
ncbi:MAG: hypothetical protein ACYTXI_14715 [Nostoc sp.]